MDTEKSIGILGIGNLLVQDEGFGVHFVEHLTKHYDIPENVSVLDGGTAGIMLAPFIEDVDVLYVIDTVSIKDEPGTIHCFSDEDVRNGNVQMRMSPHQVGLIEILSMCKVRDKAPERTEMITVVPKDLDISIGLSDCLQPKISEVTDILLKLLADRGTIIKPKESLTSA